MEIQDRAGHSLGIGYYNNHTLIAVRLLSYYKTFDLRDRLATAYRRREAYYTDSIYRLIFSESDGLPGLIVDRYAGTLVLQILTAGMERMRQEILDALRELVRPERMLLKNDSSYRKLEGLETAVEWVYGDPVSEEIIEMDGLQFLVDYASGQKTGFFLDQRENRQKIAQHAHGNHMLDLFSYSGGWALYGAKAGMTDVTAVDSSSHALELVSKMATMNGFAVKTVETDVFEFLREQYALPQRYDLIALDPPWFCRSHRQLEGALKGYREINLRAMKLLAPGGVLFSCSCSQPVTAEIFEDTLRIAAADSGRTFILKELRLQPPDHPILLNFPESQ